MSIHTDALRDIAANHGWSVCDAAADEIDDLEKAYALLFEENARLRAATQAAPSDEQIEQVVREMGFTSLDPYKFARAIAALAAPSTPAAKEQP